MLESSLWLTMQTKEGQRAMSKAKIKLNEIRELLHQSHSKELVFFRSKWESISLNTFEDMGVDLDKCIRITRMIFDEQSDAEGVYIREHYDSLREQVSRLGAQIREKGAFSRQFIITFDSMHCFQSIQLMYRDGKAIAHASMRSCNFDKNFIYDLFITYYVVGVFKRHIEDLLMHTGAKSMIEKEVIMTIGSLHILESD